MDKLKIETTRENSSRQADTTGTVRQTDRHIILDTSYNVSHATP